MAACSAKHSDSTAAPAAATASAAGSPAAAAAHPAAATPAPVAVDESRGLIVANGDSITSGAGNSSQAKTYLGQVSAGLRTRTMNLGGYGITSTVSSRGVARIPADTTNVIIDIGTNDVIAASSRADPALAAKHVKTFERDSTGSWRPCRPASRARRSCW